MSKSLFCGCDTSLENNTIWSMLDNGSQPVKLFNVDNNQLGSELLVEKIYHIAKEHCVSDILVGTEAASMHDRHLLEYLSESKLSGEFSLSFTASMPNGSKTLKRALPPRVKPTRLTLLPLLNG